MWHFKNLLSLQISLTAGLPLLVIVIVGFTIIEPQLREQVESRHRAVAVAMAGQVETYLESAGRELNNVRRMLDASPRNRWQRILDVYVDDAEIFSEILVSDNDGITRFAGVPPALRASRSNLIGIDLSRRIFFEKLKNSGQPTWSDTYLSATSGKLTVAYTMPSTDFYLTGEIELEQLSRFIDRISSTDQMQIMIIDSIGALVAHPNPDLTGQQLNLSNLQIVRTAMHGKTDLQQFDYRGQHLVGMAIPIRPLGWIALVAQPSRVAYASSSAFSIVVLLALALGLILAGSGAIRLANWVAHRIDMYSTNAQLISQGMYGLQWPESRVHEFNKLGEHLRNMESEIQRREQEIEDQRIRFQTAFETSPLAMSILNASTGNFVIVNSAWTALTGHTQEQAVGHNIDELNIWERREESSRYREQVLQKGTVRDFEVRLSRRSGEPAEVVLNSSKIVLGGEDHILTIIVDVTERNRLDRQLRKTEMLQGAILDSAGHAIISTTPDGIITTFNNAAEQMLGYQAEEMIGKQTPAIFHDTSEIQKRAKQFSAELKRTVEPGFDVFVVRSDLGLPNEFEWTYVRKDGSTFPVLLTVTAIKDENEHTTGYLGLAIDITERKEAEQILRASEYRLARQKQAVVDLAHAQRDASGHLDTLIRTTTELLSTALDVQRTSVWSFNGQEKTIRCLDLYTADTGRHEDGLVIERTANPAYFDALYNERVIVASNALTDPVTSDFAKGYLEANNIGAMLDATILRGSEMVGVVCFEHVGGSRVWTIDEQNFAVAVADYISLSMELHYHQQTSEELQKYKQNLEELVTTRTRELQAVNKELEAFSYSVSHDLRAPLRGIDGFSLALLEDYGDQLNDNAAEYLHRVRNASARMDKLIDDLLNLSRISRREMHRKQTDLGKISEEIVKQFRSMEPERKVSISIAPNLQTNGDPDLLRILMDNLIGNAWKYTSKTQNANIEIGATEVDGGRAFYVRDNGAGFDMAYSNKLFGAFQRLHNPADFPGSGIGLATVNRIINRHGGKIWAEGKIDEGAVFYFTTD